MPLAVHITSTKTSGTLSLIFHDMAGEGRGDLLASPMPADERIRRILGTPKTDDMPYGLMTHLIFAKIYVVVMDCSTAASWERSASYAKDAIRGIYDIKKHIRDLYRGKVPANMAVVFAKHDTLPDDEDAGDLAERLPDVRAAMKKYIGGDVGWFKSRLDCVELGRNGAGEVRAAGRREGVEGAAGAVLDGGNGHDAASGLPGAERTRLDAAASGLGVAKSPCGAAPEECRRPAYGKARRGHEGAEKARPAFGDGRGRAPPDAEVGRQADPPARGGGRAGAACRPATPLSYNTDEYLDMLAWLIKTANSARGR